MKIIPRPRQKKAAKAILNNLMSDKPLPAGKVLEKIGYSDGVVRTPSMVTESIGFKQALRDLGLTEELITTALVDDIREKPKFRIQELKLGAEILGMVKREEEPPAKQAGNTYNFIFSEEVQKQVKEMEEKIKARLINPNAQEN